MVFTRGFLWSLYFLAGSFAKMQLGGHGSPSMAWAAEKAKSTRCFLWCLYLVGRFYRKNKAERLTQSQSPKYLKYLKYLEYLRYLRYLKYLKYLK